MIPFPIVVLYIWFITDSHGLPIYAVARHRYLTPHTCVGRRYSLTPPHPPPHIYSQLQRTTLIPDGRWRYL